MKLKLYKLNNLKISKFLSNFNYIWFFFFFVFSIVKSSMKKKFSIFFLLLVPSHKPNIASKDYFGRKIYI